MPCSKYKSTKQRKACYATDFWRKPVKKVKRTKKRKK